MQTFLPYKNFTQSLACLDRQRLGKQRVEARQILNALADPSYGWQNHPAVRMWRDWRPALEWYHDIAIATWVSRGYNNTMEYISPDGPVNYPDWLTDDLCASHRSNLLRKFPDWYKQFGWTEPDNLPYMWPV
jgi:hypothetical protein